MMPRFFLSIVITFFSLTLAIPAFAATFTVNSTDATDDGSCDAFVLATTDCTLDEAIDAANAAGTDDLVDFAIDGSFSPTNGQYTINPPAAFSISDTVEINASAEWDTANNRPGIILSNPSTTINAFQFFAGSDGSELKGFEIEGWRSIMTLNSANNVIGTDCDGILDTRERNVLHGASAFSIYSTTSGNLIAGNLIGFDDDGTTRLPSNREAIYFRGADADDNVIGFRDGTTGNCSAATQRNIISEPSADWRPTIYFKGTSNSAPEGDAALGPDNNRVSGNYIGVDATGVAHAAGSATGSVGVELRNAATLNFVGTDGDGVDDSLERNVIFSNGTGVFLLKAGNNRISGNYIGVDSTGNSLISSPEVMENGINVRGEDNIVGWCDTSVNAALCSDSGSASNQRNVIGGAELVTIGSSQGAGIRVGFDSVNVEVYGNYIGVGADGSSDIGIKEYGVFVHRGVNDNIVGGSGNKGNTIMYNGVGIILDGDFIGSSARGDASFQVPMTNITVSGNTISNNGTYGLYLFMTELFDATVGSDSISILNNTIENNGSEGIYVLGSSPTITNNTVSNNGSYGILARPAYIKIEANGEPTLVDNSAVESYDIDDYAGNLESIPTISGNTISDNTSGGIYTLDAQASNYSTIYADNTYGDNNGNYAAEQAWRGAVEIVDTNGDPIPGAGWAGTTAVLTPSSGSILQSDTAVTAGGSDMIFGPSGLDYHDITTWFPITQYSVTTAGVATDHNAYTISSTGTWATNSDDYTFDGTDNDASFPGTLSNCLTNDGICRYQIAKVGTSTVPEAPTNISPSNGATEVSITPTLTSSAFIDAVETHATSTVNVYSSLALCNIGGTPDLYDATSGLAVTSFDIPEFLLAGRTTYAWRVAYTNSYGNTSNFSTCTTFTTGNQTPVLASNLPDQSTDEDVVARDVFDLDDYFYDPGDTLTYSVTNGSGNIPKNISVSISVGKVSITPNENYFGPASLIFTATDSEAASTSSNAIAVTVTSVNDVPEAPSAGFFPAESLLIGQLKPTIMWDQGSDIEDNSSQLSYEVRVSTDSDPVSNPSLELSTSAGETEKTTTNKLVDLNDYYYAVRTVDSDDGKSDWSEVQTFTINQEEATTVTLVKTVEILDSSLGVPAGIGAAFSSRGGAIKNVLSGAFGVSLAVVALSLISLLVVYKKPSTSMLVGVKHPAMAFAVISSQDNKGVYKGSYAAFAKRARPLARSFQISLFVAATLSLLTIFAYAAENHDGSTITPGDTLEYTIQYENTGNNTATAAVITDQITDDMSFVQGSAKINGITTEAGEVLSVSTAVLAVGDIAEGESGNVSYQVTINNPTTVTTLISNTATITSSEVQTPNLLISNTTSNPVSSGSMALHVQDTNGTPLSGITTNLYLNSVSDENLVKSEPTNTSGDVGLSGLNAGSYLVTIDLPAQYVPASTRSATVEYSETTNLTITVAYPALATVPELEESEPVAVEAPSEELVTEPEITEEEVTILIEDLVKGKIDPADLTLEERKAIVNALEELLELDEIDDKPEIVEQRITIPEAQEALELIGVTLPGATVRLQVCSDGLSDEHIVVADANGVWKAELDADSLIEGKHVLVAQYEIQGISTDKKIIGNFVNIKEQKISQTYLLILVNLGILLLVSSIINYFIARQRQRRMAAAPVLAQSAEKNVTKTTSAGAAVPISKVKRIWNQQQLIFGGGIFVVLIALSVYSLIPSQAQEAEFTSLINIPELSIGSANDQPIDLNNSIVVKDDKVVIRGNGLPNATGSITLCEGVESYAIDVDENGSWTLEIPLDEIPNQQARFKIDMRDEFGNEIIQGTEMIEISVNDVERGAPNWLVVIMLISAIIVSNYLEWQYLSSRRRKQG